MTDDPTTNLQTQSLPGMKPARPIESAGTASEAPDVELLHDPEDVEESAVEGEEDVDSGSAGAGVESLDGSEGEIAATSQSGASAEPFRANPGEATPSRDQSNP